MMFFTFKKRAGEACSPKQVASPERTRGISNAARSSVIRMLFVTEMLAVTSLFAYAYTKATGKVVDAATKEPLIGATILVKGTPTAASAGLDGSFKLSVP